MARPSRALWASEALAAALKSLAARAFGIAGLAAILGLVMAAVLAGPSFEAVLHSYEWYTVSPLNPGDGGASAFYSYAARVYGAITGGPFEAAEAALRGVKTLYVVLGPDKPFTAAEIRILSEAYQSGNLRVLVADDLGVTKNLLETLQAPGLGELEVNPRGEGEWRYVLEIVCGDGLFASASKALQVTAPASQVLCRYSETGDAAAAISRGPGWSAILVVGDPSIYSNFLYRGEVKWLHSSREVAVYTLKAAGAEEARLIIFDTIHYNVTEFRYRGHYGIGILAEGFHSLHNGLSGFAHTHPLAAAATLTGVLIAVSAIATGPERGLLRPSRSGMGRGDVAAAAQLLGLLGIETEEDLLARADPREVAGLIEESLGGDVEDGAG